MSRYGIGRTDMPLVERQEAFHDRARPVHRGRPIEEMSRRGYPVVDTDDDGWTLSDGTWDEPRMAALLAERSDVK